MGPMARGIALVALGALVVAGCTGGEGPQEPPSAGPATTAVPVSPATATPKGSPVEPIEFNFRAPEPPCPPVSALETLPLSDARSYESFEPSRFEHDDSFYMICSYNRVGARGDEDMLAEEHASVSANVTLYRRWEDSPNSGLEYWPELPVGSDDLDEWERAAWTSDDRRVRWEGCGPNTPCEEGEEPIFRTHASRWAFTGHVGNLDFDEVTVQYIGAQIPADVESKVVAIFRDFVLAVIETYERVD